MAAQTAIEFDPAIRDMIRLSAFCFIFKRDDTICLYHSLGISPIFLGAGFAPVVNRLKWEPISIEKFLALAPGKIEAKKQLLTSLMDKKFIVPVDYDETVELKSLRKKYTGEPRVSLAYILLNDNCNLNCRYCFVRNQFPAGYQTTMMSAETAEQAIAFSARQFKLSGTAEATIIFYGGEPLLNINSLYAAAREIKKLQNSGELPGKTLLSVITNGTLVTAEFAVFCRDNEISVTVSYDGPANLSGAERFSEENGNLDAKIIEGIKILRGHRVKTGVSCTITDANIKHFDDIISWFADELKITGIGINPVRQIPPFRIGDDYAEKISDALIRGYEYLTSRGIYEDRMGRKVRAFSEGTVYPFDCAGCGEQIVIAPDGGVGVCAGYLGSKKYFVTNIFDSSFDHRVDPAFILWSKRSPLQMAECVGCPAIAICGGGCPYSAEINFGRLNAQDRMFCIHALKTLEYLIWKLFSRLR